MRVIGPSGFGKTRFVNTLFLDQVDPLSDFLDSQQVIYAVHRDVKDRIVNITREISQSGSPSLLIVDDCPDEIHLRLAGIVNTDGSNCRLITMGVETESQGLWRNLVVELAAASGDLIDSIAGSVFSKLAQQRDTSFVRELVRELAEGFPKMAVLAAQAALEGDEELVDC